MALHLRAAQQANVIQLQIGGALDLNLRMAPDQEQYTGVVTVQYGQFAVTAKGNEMQVTIPAGQKGQFRVKWVDVNGNDAVVDGPVRWASSDETLAAIAVDQTDSSLCTVSAPGSVGDAQVTATGDADLGAGVRELVELLSVHVIAGEAVAGVMEMVGELTPIDEATPA